MPVVNDEYGYIGEPQDASAGGTIAPGTYSARRFDPRTGEEVVLPEVTGGGAVTFKASDGQDSVLYLRGDRSW